MKTVSVGAAFATMRARGLHDVPAIVRPDDALASECRPSRPQPAVVADGRRVALREPSELARYAMLASIELSERRAAGSARLGPLPK
jgi:hypothetical protein